MVPPFARGWGHGYARRVARRLPATQALQAFAQAARLGSFKRAAHAMHVSPSALSRQIQALEADLGVALFRRLNPGLELTDAGRKYLAVVDNVLGQLSAAQAAVCVPSRPLRISALESFVSSWLVPNLPSFESLHPDIPLEIEATLAYADFARDPVDVAIRFGTGPWHGVHNEPLLPMTFAPACSPRLREGPIPLREPADLAAHTLIHIAQVPEAWRTWLRSVGVGDLQPRRQLTYDHVSIALSAAECGQGLVLLPDVLLSGRIPAGILCRPIDAWSTADATYHFVCRPEARNEPRVAALRDWLVAALQPHAINATALAD